MTSVLRIATSLSWGTACVLLILGVFAAPGNSLLANDPGDPYAPFCPLLKACQTQGVGVSPCTGGCLNISDVHCGCWPEDNCDGAGGNLCCDCA